MNEDGVTTPSRNKPEYDDLGEFPNSAQGWCRNFKGFIQYRELLENNIEL